MKEQSTQLSQRLGRGLYHEPRMGGAVDAMKSLKNLRPAGVGASTPERIEYPFGVDYPTMDWPFPMVHVGEHVLLEFGATSVHSVDPADWTKTSISTWSATTPANAFSITRGELWQVASFQDLWFATNGAALLWDIPSNTGGKVLGVSTPTMAALGKVNNRLLLGGLAGDWFTGDEWELIKELWRETSPLARLTHRDLAWDTRWVVWGERGGGDTGIPFYILLAALGVFGVDAFEAAFSDIVQRFENAEIGMLPVRHPGELRALRQLGERGVVYGAQGISLLSPSEPGFLELPAADVGIPGRGCVGGGPHEHCFVNNDNRVIRWPAGGGMKDEGYDAHVTGVETTVGAFGTEGYDNGEFIGPIYVAVSDKRIYVSDVSLGRIQLFDHSGNYISQFAVANAGAMALYEDELYVLDVDAHTVRVYNLAGTFVRSWGGAGSASGTFTGMGGIAVWDGEVYVVDSTRVQVFSTAGVFARTWGSAGSAASEFSWPKGICVHRDLVWVADTANGRIQQFTRTGIFIREYGSQGAAIEEFDLPVSVAAAGEEVYILEHTNARIQVYDWEGNYLRTFGQQGTAPGAFLAPWSIQAAGGRLYVGDSSNHRVQILDDALVQELIVSYDPLLAEYWFASQHGSHVLNFHGLGHSDQGPTSLARWGGNRLIGAAANQEPGTKRWRLRTTSIDLGVRDSKRVSAVLMQTHGTAQGRARLLWRAKKDQWFRNGAWAPLNAQGVAFPVTSFNDGELQCEGNYEADVPGSIDTLELRYLLQGRVFRRGI